MNEPRITFLLMIILSLAVSVFPNFQISNQNITDRQIAARFAPLFYQGLGEKPRSDHITNFDFDGDWRGDNNWENAENKKFSLRAYIYYAVSETKTHYFIHYAVFHPRDYKGGEERGRFLSDLIREGSKIVGDRDPSGLLAEATVAHENDMEGALVVVRKGTTGSDVPSVQFVETLQHNSFGKFVAAGIEIPGLKKFQTRDEHVVLYIEPRGHGIEALRGDEKQRAGKSYLVYRFKANAEDPERIKGSPVGYDLLPIETTLWAKAGGGEGKGSTYGETYDYATVTVNIVGPRGRVSAKMIKVGARGSAFLGVDGGQNMARPPWGWFDADRRSDPLGLWFFDPATIVKRDFTLNESFSTAYIRTPSWAAN